jgi:hypothetical protein
MKKINPYSITLPPSNTSTTGLPLWLGMVFIKMKEVFKSIPNYEGLYEAGSHGNIKSLKYGGRDKSGILKKSFDRAGYEIVTLCKNKLHITKTVHRLIATAFFGEHKGLQVNHKDGNKSNNNVVNLEFVTAKENIRHGIKNGLIKPNTTEIAENKRKKIAQIDLITSKTIRRFDSAHHAAKSTGINRGNICSCARGECVSAGKYKWQYYA